MAVVPDTSDIRVAQGSDATVRIPDVSVDGVLVVDFTGWTFRAQLRPFATSPDLYYTFPAEDIATEAPDVLLRLPAAISSAFEWFYACYGVEAVAPDGTVQRIAQGLFQLDPETTR